MAQTGYHHVLNHLTEGSSINLYDTAVRWAWLTVLRMARRGVVENLTVASLSLEAHIPLPDAARALKIFTSPDEYSSTPDDDGVRLKPLDGEPNTYRLVTWERQKEKIEKANAAMRKAKQRENEKCDASQSVTETSHTGYGKPDTEDGTTKRIGAAKRGTRLSDDWLPSEEEATFAFREGVNPTDLERVATEFRNYWTAVPGQKGLKLSWTKTWQNHILSGMWRRVTNGKGKPPEVDLHVGKAPERTADQARADYEYFKPLVDAWLEKNGEPKSTEDQRRFVDELRLPGLIGFAKWREIEGTYEMKEAR